MGNLGNHFRLLEIVPGNIHARGASGEVSDRNEKHVFGNWRKDDLCHKVAEYLAALCSVSWKLELQCVELISPYCYGRMQEERKKIKKEAELEDVKNLSLSILQNNNEACSGENTKGVAENDLLQR